MTSAPPRLASERHAQRDGGAVGCGIHHRVRPLVDARRARSFRRRRGRLAGRARAARGASTIRRMRLVNATDSMTVACCQTAVRECRHQRTAMGSAAGERDDVGRTRTMVGDDSAGDRIPTFCREGVFEDAPHPHAAGIDVEAVEL